jgi:hypothetical protein
MISLTKINENIFLNNILKPLSDREKSIVSVCNSLD